MTFTVLKIYTTRSRLSSQIHLFSRSTTSKLFVTISSFIFKFFFRVTLQQLGPSTVVGSSLRHWLPQFTILQRRSEGFWRPRRRLPSDAPLPPNKICNSPKFAKSLELFSKFDYIKTNYIFKQLYPRWTASILDTWHANSRIID